MSVTYEKTSEARSQVPVRDQHRPGYKIHAFSKDDNGILVAPWGLASIRTGIKNIIVPDGVRGIVVSSYDAFPICCTDLSVTAVSGGLSVTIRNCTNEARRIAHGEVIANIVFEPSNVLPNWQTLFTASQVVVPAKGFAPVELHDSNNVRPVLFAHQWSLLCGYPGLGLMDSLVLIPGMFDNRPGALGATISNTLDTDVLVCAGSPVGAICSILYNPLIKMDEI